jgi:hypothetical protein
MVRIRNAVGNQPTARLPRLGTATTPTAKALEVQVRAGDSNRLESQVGLDRTVSVSVSVECVNETATLNQCMTVLVTRPIWRKSDDAE